jgi:hypothetical protein
MSLQGDFLRERSRRDALELVDELLQQFLRERRYGRIEIVLQDGTPRFVREERVHKFDEPPPDRGSAA